MEKLKIKPFFWNGKRWFTIAEAERIRNYQLVYSFKRSLILVLECWIKHPTIPLPDLADMTNTDLFEVEKTIDEYKKSGCIIVGSKMNHSGFDRGF